MVTDSPSTPSLREQRKQHTRTSLTDAAYHIVRTQGMEALSAEAVAERAGVSRRTFFNYFPSIESVLDGAIADFFDGLRAHLTDGPADEPLMAAVDRLVTTPTNPQLLERVTVLGSLGMQSPAARHIMQDHTQEWRMWLEDFVRERVTQPRDDVFVTNLATAIVAAAESAMHLWHRRSNGVVDDDTVAEYHHILGQCVSFVRFGFEPRPGDDPATT